MPTMRRQLPQQMQRTVTTSISTMSRMTVSMAAAATTRCRSTRHKTPRSILAKAITKTWSTSINNIEAIDLTGGDGNITLGLDSDDVIKLTDDDNEWDIILGEGDEVDFGDGISRSRVPMMMARPTSPTSITEETSSPKSISATTRTTRARYPNDRGMKRRVSPTTPPFTYFDALTVTRAELFCHQILFHALEAVHWICQANTSSPHRVRRSGRR